MNIPDPAVYAAVPVAGAFVVWIGKQFVQWASGSPAASGAGVIPKHSIELADYTQIADALTKSLNGRYMFAPECRGKFDEVNRKMDDMARSLTDIADQMEDAKTERLEINKRLIHVEEIRRT